MLAETLSVAEVEVLILFTREINEAFVGGGATAVVSRNARWREAIFFCIMTVDVDKSAAVGDDEHLVLTR